MLQDTSSEENHTGNGTEKSKRKRGRPKGSGRKDASKQPAAKQPKLVADRLDELVRLQVHAAEASEDAKTAIAKCAEDSGYLASSINKLVKAKAGDKLEEKHREVEQQAELFDEVDPA